MRIFIVYLAFSWAYGVALGQDDDESQSEITYQLQVHRNDLLTPVNSVVSVDPPRVPGFINDKVNNGQLPVENVTFTQAVTYDSPILMFGDVTYDNDTLDLIRIHEEDKVSVCENYDDGTWVKVMTDVLKAELFPKPSCPVEPGNSLMFADFQVNATFYQPLKCGDYGVYLMVDWGDEWLFLFYFTFNITMVDNYVSQ